MVDVEKLKDKMYHSKISNKEMAKRLHMSTKTFYLRLKSGCFYSDEMDCMVDILHLSHNEAVSIFFVPKVTDTKQTNTA